MTREEAINHIENPSPKEVETWKERLIRRDTY